MQTNTVHGGNVDCAANDFLHLLQLTVELIVQVEDLFGRFVELLSFACEAELLLAAINDQDTEMFFHCP